MVRDAEQLVRALNRARPTYPEIGATADDRLPTGYRTLDRTACLGHGRQLLDAAGEALLTWRMHAAAGLPVTGSGRADAGATVVLTVGRGPARLLIPCRVIYTITEPDRRAFAYGTLPGHPEIGEEAFAVDLDREGRVTFTVRAFSRPANLLVRLGGPINRLVQDVATRRYLTAIREVTGTSHRGPRAR